MPGSQPKQTRYFGNRPYQLRWREVGGITLDTSSRLFLLSQETYHEAQFTGISVHRIRDFRRYHFNCIPPTSQLMVSFGEVESMTYAERGS